MAKKNPMAVSKYKNAPTSVWWDIEYCPVPRDCNPLTIADSIKSALRKLNYNGEVSIFAYGNLNHVPNFIKKALTSTGIVLHNFQSTATRKNTLQLFSERLSWRYDHGPPVNMMFISHDVTFSSYLEDSNILWAHPPNPLPRLIDSASATWLWRSLFSEEVNQP